MLHKNFKSIETGFKHFETELLGADTSFAGTYINIFIFNKIKIE